MHQLWDKLLFLHWPVHADQLRGLIPARLEVDLYEGSAWVAVAPFTMRGIRPRMLPAIPGLSASHELNVRTYVTMNGVPGVWFFSLDAANPFIVWGARNFYHLPYYRARMELSEEKGTISYSSRRLHGGHADAEFVARWRPGEALPQAAPGSLDHFLTERYCLYASHGDRLFRARIQHRPWPLRRATLEHLSSTMLESHGLVVASAHPLLHALREPLHVSVSGPVLVQTSDRAVADVS